MAPICIVMLALMGLALLFAVIFTCICYKKITNLKNDSTEQLPRHVPTSTTLPRDSLSTPTYTCNRNRNHSRRQDHNHDPTHPNASDPNYTPPPLPPRLQGRASLFNALTPNQIMDLPLLYNGRVQIVEPGRQVVVNTRTISCAVCQELVAPSQPYRVLPCSHAAHPRCIFYWLLESSRCPYCGICVRETLQHFARTRTENRLNRAEFEELGRFWFEERRQRRQQRVQQEQEQNQTQGQAQQGSVENNAVTAQKEATNRGSDDSTENKKKSNSETTANESESPEIANTGQSSADNSKSKETGNTV